MAIHVPCSSKQMKKDGYFEKIAKACSESVTMSPVPCCGAAGDRGMRFPEISGGGVASQVYIYLCIYILVYMYLLVCLKHVLVCEKAHVLVCLKARVR